MKLAQIIAVEKQVKSRSYALVTEHDKLCQKSSLFNGQTKRYQPLDEEDKDVPEGETVRVQQNVNELLTESIRAWSELFDTTATKDWGNTKAKASIIIDGKVLVEDAPVPFLLFVEKQLNDIRTAVSRLPVLAPDTEWQKDASTGMWASDRRTHRQKKVAKVIVLAPATEQHPAQTQLVSEDVIVGYWHSRLFSTAIVPVRQKHLLERIDRLQIAVKQAREQANGTDIEQQTVGARLLGWIFE